MIVFSEIHVVQIRILLNFFKKQKCGAARRAARPRADDRSWTTPAPRARCCGISWGTCAATSSPRAARLAGFLPTPSPRCPLARLFRIGYPPLTVTIGRISKIICPPSYSYPYRSKNRLFHTRNSNLSGNAFGLFCHENRNLMRW